MQLFDIEPRIGPLTQEFLTFAMNREHPAWWLLVELNRYKKLPFEVAAQCVIIDKEKTGHFNAAVYWWIERANDTLPRAGWRIEVDPTTHNVVLEPITYNEHEVLHRRWLRRRSA